MKSLSLLLAISTLIPLTNARLLNFIVTAYCPLNKTWCLKQNVKEADPFPNIFIGNFFGDEYFEPGIKCGSSHTLVNDIYREEHSDGAIDDGFFELYSDIEHSCTDDQSFVKGDRYYLSSYDGHKSQSNHEKVAVRGVPISIIYKIGNVYKNSTKD